MRKLTNEDIQKNSVDTINQYKVLQYLKKNLNIYEFNIYLYDTSTIKVVDKKEDSLLFKFKNNKVEYFELNLEIEQELEI
jgi:hypothetical protein